MFHPEGIYSAFMTSFRPDGSMNEQVIRDMVEFMISKGVDGIFPVSTVGEFVHMSMEERKRLMKIVVEQAKGRVAIVAGIGASCPRKSVELARYAKEIGADAVVLLAPYFFINPQDIVEKYVEVVARSVDIPLILYNIPFFTNPILPDTVERLCRIPNIVAIKDSSGNLINLMNNIEQSKKIRDDFNVLIGYEEGLFPALMAGAKGCFTATVGILPEIMKDIYTSTLRGDYQRAREVQFSIIGLIRLMKVPLFPFGFKAGMEARGFPMGPPLQAFSAQQEEVYQRTKAEITEQIGKLVAGYSVGSTTVPTYESRDFSTQRKSIASTDMDIEKIVRQVVSELSTSKKS